MPEDLFGRERASALSALKKIRAAQHAFRSDENARKIAVYIAGLAEPLEYTLEHARRNSIRHQRIRKKKSPASRV